MVPNNSKSLRAILRETAGCQVYYNPPETLKMEFPCIRITDTSLSHKKANNNKYIRIRGYSAIYFTRVCDDPVIWELDKLPYIDWGSSYRGSNNLYCYPFTVKIYDTNI